MKTEPVKKNKSVIIKKNKGEAGLQNCSNIEKYYLFRKVEKDISRGQNYQVKFFSLLRLIC